MYVFRIITDEDLDRIHTKAMQSGIDFIVKKLIELKYDPEYKLFADDTAETIVMFETKLATCCPGHTADNLISIYEGLAAGIRYCLETECNDTMGHLYYAQIMHIMVGAKCVIEINTERLN